MGWIGACLCHIRAESITRTEARALLPCVRGFKTYGVICDRIAASGYVGFELAS